MAKITGKTEFARRVAALGLTLVDLEKMIPFKLATLQGVSAGQRPLSPQLDWALRQVEDKMANINLRR